MHGGRYGDFGSASAFSGDKPLITKQQAERDHYDLKLIMDAYTRNRSNGQSCKEICSGWENEKKNYSLYETKEIRKWRKEDSIKKSREAGEIEYSGKSEGDMLKAYEDLNQRHMFEEMRLFFDSIRKYL